MDEDAAYPAGEHEERTLSFMSIQEAHRFLSGIADGFGAGRYFRAVAEYVLDPSNAVFGSADQYFNFAMTYDRAGDTLTELRLCLHALAIYPYDVDLMARAIDACGQCGQFERGLELIERLEQTPMQYWEKHYPFFDVTNFYYAYLSACPRDQIEDVLEKGVAMAKNYQHYLPMDERGYDQEALMYIRAGKMAEASQVLQHAIFGEVPQPDGGSASLIAAQCCVTMLTSMLKDSTDYDLIIKVAQRGIRNTARDQPAANAGYFMYRQALALDAIISQAPKHQDGYGNQDKVREALTAYRCAYQLNSDSARRRSDIRDRYTILCHKSGIMDLPLEARTRNDEDED